MKAAPPGSSFVHGSAPWIPTQARGRGDFRGNACASRCYLKDILGRTIDSFSVRSEMGGSSAPAQCADGTDNDADGLVDYPNDPGCSSSADTDEANAPPAGITLTANGYKAKGFHKVDLTWSGAAGTNVDVYRNGVRVATTPNDRLHTRTCRARRAWASRTRTRCARRARRRARGR